MNPNQQIIALHRPGLNRIEIPAIIGDAPACTECRKAWPCPTINVMQSVDELDNVYDYANYQMNRVFEAYRDTLLSAVIVTRGYYASSQNVEISAHWSNEMREYTKRIKHPRWNMPMLAKPETRQQVTEAVNDLLTLLEAMTTDLAQKETSNE